jgi:hypothetical protein
MKYNFTKFLQEGGPVEGAPAPEQGPESAPQGSGPQGPQGPEGPGGPEGGMEQQVMQMAQQIAQQIGDPQVIGMLGEALIQIAQGAGEQQAPAFQRRGGKMVRIR